MVYLCRSNLENYIMKLKMLIAFLGLGWVFLALFLMSGYYYNKLSNNSERFQLSPITWESHMQVFNGVVQCNLMEEDLLKRKKVLKETVFSNVLQRKESADGVTYYFEYKANLLESVLEHVQIEKACCPFFKFDISILPFNQGFALQISGSEEALKMLKEIEPSDF